VPILASAETLRLGPERRHDPACLVYLWMSWP